MQSKCKKYINSHKYLPSQNLEQRSATFWRCDPKKKVFSTSPEAFILKLNFTLQGTRLKPALLAILLEGWKKNYTTFKKICRRRNFCIFKRVNGVDFKHLQHTPIGVSYEAEEIGIIIISMMETRINVLQDLLLQFMHFLTMKIFLAFKVKP